MGVRISVVRNHLNNHSPDEVCYPVSPYTPFPFDKWPIGDDGLIADFHILPEKMHRGTDDGLWFWWCDAQFVPFNDQSIFASCSAFHPRQMHCWAPVPNALNGKMLLYLMKGDNSIQCNIFSRTSSSVFPKVQPHPLGELVGYCGTGEVVVMDLQGDPVYSRNRDLANAVHVYCALAKNGVYFASIKRGNGNYFLETYDLGSTILTQESVRCHKICPGFSPNQATITETVACKFSPNSKHIAVSSSSGFLFVAKRWRLALFKNVCGDILDVPLSSPEAFDYDPRHPFQIMAVASSDGIIQIVNIESDQVSVTTESPACVDCLVFSKDGFYLAAGLHDTEIILYDSEFLTPVHRFPMSGLTVETIGRRRQTNFPAILHLSFSQNGLLLSSTTCDGHLRLWRVPRLLSLQEICRDRILQHIPIYRVKKLKEVPEAIRNFLMYKFF